MMSRRGRILTHPDDIHCVVFHLLVVLAYAVAFWLYLNPTLVGIDGSWELAAFMAAAALMLGWISGIDVGVNFHNHVHRPIFRVRRLNVWFGRLWTVTGGWPALFWEHSHVTVHHDHVMRPTDWTLPRRREDGTFESLFVYSLSHWPWRYAVHLWRDFRSGRGGLGAGRRAGSELAWFAAFWSIPFFIDPMMALLLWALPHVVANVYVMGPGMYAQHFGCEAPDDESTYAQANTFLSPFFNLTMFNIGYHIEHHSHPSVHWSVLPQLHERLKGKLVEHGGHVVPFGYYRAAQLLSALWTPGRGRRIFTAQHPDYRSRTG